MTDDVTHDATKSRARREVAPSRLEERLEAEILKTLEDDGSSLRAADFYLRLGPLIADAIGALLDRLVDKGKVAREGSGLYRRRAEEAPVAAEHARPVRDSKPSQELRRPIRKDDALADGLMIGAGSGGQLRFSVSAGGASQSMASAPPSSDSLEGEVLSLEVDGTSYQIDLRTLRIRRLSFKNLPEKAVFLRLLDYPPASMMGELACQYQDIDGLISDGIANEPWMLSVEAARRYAQMHPDWVIGQHSLVAWAASLFSEDRRLLSALFTGKGLEEARQSAGISQRTAAKILRDSLCTFPQLHRLVGTPPAAEERNEEQPGADVSGGESEAEGDSEVLLEPFAFDDASDAVAFLHALGASAEQVCARLGIDSDRYGTLLSRGGERWLARKREGRGSSRVDLCAWASDLRRSDARLVLLSLLGEDPQRICAGTSYSLHELDARLDKVLETAPLRQRRHAEKGVRAPEVEGPPADRASAEPPSLAQWLASLDGVARGALLTIFSGARVSDFAAKNGISTTDARRAYQSALRLRPRLAEDRYLYLYETYNVSQEDFTELTGLGSESYGYLRNVSSRGGGYRHLRPAGLTDERLPEDVRDRLRGGSAGIASSNMLRIDGRLVRLSFEGLVRHFGSVRAQARPMSINDFSAAYKEFLDDLGLGDREDLLLPENPQTAVQKLSKTSWFLIASLKHVRYYDFDAYDFSPLVEVLRSAAGRNAECSSKMIFTANRTLMETFDLVDEYDLFVVVRRLIREAGIPGVRTGTCPILRFGECDRHAQVLGVIKEVSPATADEVAVVYEERYGVPSASFKSSYLREFAAYRKNGRYEYHERELTVEMREFLSSELKGDYLVLSLVQARFAARFSEASKLDVNDMALAPFGYHTSHDLIVRDGIDERVAFGALIDSHEQFAFGDVGFDEAITKYPAFRSELRTRLASLSYVEWMRGHYLSVARLSSAFDVGEHELRAYMRYISELAEPGVPFTVPGLLIAGRHHDLDSLRDDAGVEDSLYEGLIEFMPASEGIKRTSFDGTTVYCRSHGSFSTAEFLSYLANREGHIELEDLVDLLEDEYGISTSVGYVRNCVERAASEGVVFHNQALDTLLPSKEANAAFVRSCIDRS